MKVKSHPKKERRSRISKFKNKFSDTRKYFKKLKERLGIRDLVMILLVFLIIFSVFFPLYEYLITRSARAATVEINPGTDINATIASHPAGTIFKLKAGIHRQQTIGSNLQAGDIFIGEYIDEDNYAVLNGSKVLTGWVQDGSRWYVTGQTQEGPIHPPTDPWNNIKICQDGYSMCRFSDELFVTNPSDSNDIRRLKREDTLNNTSTGEWYFDLANNRIYIGENPASKTVETTMSQYAFNSGINQITIKNLVIEKYGTPAQNAVISLTGSGHLIEHNEIRFNHGNGVATGAKGALNNSVVQKNHLHHQGFTGLGGAGSNLSAKNNNIGFNNEARFYKGFDGGGSKFSHTSGLLVENNYSHDNYNSGLWTDINNINTTYKDNVVINNDQKGIEHEISYAATLTGNKVGYNKDHQIYIFNSQNVNVTNNTVVVGPSNGNGIYSQNQERGGPGTSLDGQKWVLKNLNVTNNTIYNSADRGIISGLGGASNTTNPTASAPSDFASAAASTSFNFNTYYTPSASSTRWTWGPWFQHYSFANFRSTASQELNGTVVTSGYSIPSMTTWANDWLAANTDVGPLAESAGSGICGDGTTQNPNSLGQSELCDDGNTNNGDGCSSICIFEPGGSVDHLSGWTNRKRLTIDANQIPGSTDLTNFVMLVTLTSDSDLAARAQDDGDDIVFTASDGVTIYDYEIVSFNGTTGSLTAWVKVPTLSATANTDIYMYYNNTITPSLEDSAGTWSEYKGVWHLEEDPSTTAPQMLDSTTNNNRLSSGGTMTNADLIAGKIGNAINFDGSNDNLNVADPVNGSLDIGTEDFTMQLWLKTTTATSMHLMAKGANSGDGARIYMNGSLSSRIGFKIDGTTDSIDTTPGSYTNNLANGSWHLVHVTFDRDGNATIYNDGASKFSVSITNLSGESMANSSPFQIARYEAGQYFNGDLDEPRLYNGLKTTDYIASEYANQNSPSTFYSLSTEEIINPTFCGDGETQDPNDAGVSEVCDDGNESNLDQCSSSCLNSCSAPEIWNGTACFNPTTNQSETDYFILQAENFKAGGQAVAYNETTPTNLGGEYRNEAVDIKSITTGEYATGFNETGEWFEYTVNVQQTANYNVMMRAASGEANGGQVRVDLDGNSYATLSLANTGSYSNYANVTQSGTQITSGTHTFRVTILDQWLDIDYLRFDIQAATCGDDNVDAGEQCDDGANNGQVCTAAYGGSCNYCSNSCTTVTVNGASCGDGTTQTGDGEQCDDGGNNGQTCVPEYGGSCNYCNNSCQTTTVNAANCGDGNLDAEDGEECDEGANNGQTCSASYGTSCNYCSNVCQSVTVSGAYCGDGTVQGGNGEQCDSGSVLGEVSCTPSYGQTCNYCNASCQTITNSAANCGDGIVDSSFGEQCDDNNTNNGDGCSNVCHYEVSSTQVVCGKIDINDDGRLTLVDFANFSRKYSQFIGNSDQNPITCVDTVPQTGCRGVDTNTDGKVSLVDFASFSTRFGSTKSCVVQ